MICGGDFHGVSTVLYEDIVTGVVPSAAHVSKDPPVVNWKVASRPIPIDMNTVGVSPGAITQVLIGTGTSTPPVCIRSQDIGSPRGSIGPWTANILAPYANWGRGGSSTS